MTTEDTARNIVASILQAGGGNLDNFDFGVKPIMALIDKSIDQYKKAASYYKAALRHEIPPFIPCRVRLLKQVTSDPSPFSEQITAPPGEYYVRSNKLGAIWIEELHLGLKPSEFEVIEWTENTK